VSETFTVLPYPRVAFEGCCCLCADFSPWNRSRLWAAWIKSYTKAFFEAVVDETNEDGGFTGGLLAQENHFDLALDLCEGRLRLFLLHLNEWIYYLPQSDNISMTEPGILLKFMALLYIYWLIKKLWLWINWNKSNDQKRGSSRTFIFGGNFQLSTFSFLARARMSISFPGLTLISKFLSWRAGSTTWRCALLNYL
jgi:hypothetical protein